MAAMTAYVRSLRNLSPERRSKRRGSAGVRIGGTIREVSPSYYRVAGLSQFVRLGDRVGFSAQDRTQIGEVVPLDDSGARQAFRRPDRCGHRHACLRRRRRRSTPHPSWKGRVINALGEPIDGMGPSCLRARPFRATPSPADRDARARVKTPLRTGVRVIDLFTPLCAGQRIGIFAGSGVGKSTLLSMLAGSRGFDTVVVALVGERGREVREFLEDALAPICERAVTVVVDRRRKPDDAPAGAENGRWRSPNISAICGDSVLLIVEFGHALRPRGARCGARRRRAGRCARLRAERLQRPAEAARARGARRGRARVDHRHVLRAGRRRRPQRPGRRQHPRHARRAHRARPRHRRPGALSGGQRALLRLAPCRPCLDAGADASSCRSCAR